MPSVEQAYFYSAPSVAACANNILSLFALPFFRSGSSLYVIRLSHFQLQLFVLMIGRCDSSAWNDSFRKGFLVWRCSLCVFLLVKPSLRCRECSNSDSLQSWLPLHVLARSKFCNRMVACHPWASIACHGHICALAKANLQDSNRFWHLLFSIWCCWIGTTVSRQCNLSDKACLCSAFYHVVNEGSIEGFCFRLGSLYWRVQACT